MKKFLLNAVNVICILLFVWFVLSFFDTTNHNTDINPQYAEWNVFLMMFDD